MKKLMIIAAVIFTAAVVNAAAAVWSVTANNLYDGKGDKAAKLTTGTSVLVFDAGIIDQAALFKEFAKGTSLAGLDGYAGSSAIGSTAGVIPTSTTFTYKEQGSGATDFYFAIIADNAIYLSKTVTKTANTTSTAAGISFGSQAPSTGATSKSLPTTGFVGVGQWASAVPEPTSGLLVMLGVGLMALRRRRA